MKLAEKFIDIEEDMIYICYDDGSKFKPVQHQYNGINCSQGLVDLKPHEFVKQSDLFSERFLSFLYSPAWWYGCWHRREVDDNGKYRKYLVPTPPGFREIAKLRIGEKPEDIDDFFWESDKMEQRFINHMPRIYLDELPKFFQDSLNYICKIKELPYSEFRITEKVTEAFLHVQFLHRGLVKSGYIVWQNCD